MERIANFEEEKRTKIKNDFKEQFFVNELKGHFNLRNPNKDKPSMVYFVVRLYKKQIKISLGRKVYPNNWNGLRANEDSSLPILEINNNRLLNETISLFNARFEEYKKLVNDDKILLSKELLKQYITTGEDMSNKISKSKNIDIKETMLNYLNNDKSIKDSTKANNIRFLNEFGEYLSKFRISNYTDITREVMKGFQKWCIENTKGKNGRKASAKTINQKIKCINILIKRYLVENGFITGSHFHNIKIQPLKEKNIDDEIALRDDELTLLFNYKCHSEMDEEIKDLFLLECTTGQRFSDVDKVDDFIEKKDDRIYFNLIQNKGGNKIQVDIIFQMAVDILEKYNFKLPSFDRKIFNKHIKEIAKCAGIEGTEQIRYDEVGESDIKVLEKERYNCISSHTGRRTFITMLSLRGYNYSEIARYSGHAKLEMVRLYDKSKDGTKLKGMFERLMKERPEQVLKLCNEENYNNNTELFDKLLNDLKRQTIKIEGLKESIQEHNKKNQQLKGMVGIEGQISKFYRNQYDELLGLVNEGIDVNLIKKLLDDQDNMAHFLDVHPEL